jgi:multisubunit Na+/H+ antiporter MnhG subunit
VSGLVGALLALAVLASWLGVFALARTRSAMRRIHAVSFLGWGMGLPIAAAALLTDGLTPRDYKCVLIWAAVVLASALLAHVTGRSLHLREGEMR